MNLIRVGAGIAVERPGQAPLVLGPFLGIGLNYAAHAKEQGSELPAQPLLFMKNPRAACLSGDAIVIPPICNDPPQTDFEGELAVIIGRDAKDVNEPAAHSYVLGYTCANDVSARWWQKKGSGGQFCRGKSFDTFCPLGPGVTPAAEIKDPQVLRLTTRLNGQTMQDSTTGDMIFGISTLIADLSRGMTLAAGTVLLTGTPPGVGMARNPPVYLKDGDVVEVEIAGIGVLRNPVRALRI